MNEILKIENEILIECLDKKATEVTIPDGVTAINAYAFSGCNSLTTVTIPDSVTAVGEGAFAFCESLTAITIPNSVTDIGEYAFYNCSSLKTITIPDSVTAISYEAFASCYNLKTITVLGNMKKIEGSAFYGCDNLKTKKDYYKAVNIKNNKFICDNYKKSFEYNIGEWTDEITDIGICKSGYHYCTNLFDIFNYYCGKLNKDIAIFTCEVGDRVICNDKDSKCCTNKIKLVKRLTNEEIIKLLNNQ